jgi:hypothetical protein
MKYELRYLDGFPSFHDMQGAVWGLQRQTREILNKTLQMAFHWDYISREHFKETGAYLDVLAETGYKRFDGYVYECLKSEYPDIASKNLNATIQKAWKKYKTAKLDVLRGTMSLPSYRSDQPLTLNKNNVKLRGDCRDASLELTLFSKAYKAQHDLCGNVRFAIPMHDNTQRTIFQNLMDDVYALGECQLVYDKKKWFLLVTYIFTPEQPEKSCRKTGNVIDHKFTLPPRSCALLLAVPKGAKQNALLAHVRKCFSNVRETLTEKDPFNVENLPVSETIPGRTGINLTDSAVVIGARRNRFYNRIDYVSHAMLYPGVVDFGNSAPKDLMLELACGTPQGGKIKIYADGTTDEHLIGVHTLSPYFSTKSWNDYIWVNIPLKKKLTGKHKVIFLVEGLGFVNLKHWKLQ